MLVPAEAVAPVTPHDLHGSGGGPTLELIVVIAAAAAIAAYAGAVVVSRRRGRPWPLSRMVLWSAGVVAATVAVVGPLASATHESFVAHMWSHLLGGMLAPLLLVLAAPVTLALRTLDVTPARRLSRLLRSLPARFVAHPVTALALSAGGLWLLYVTPLFEAMRADPLLHLIVHAHLLAAGAIFTAAIVGLDPRPHPYGPVLLAVVLAASLASHGILAKFLAAHPPGSVTPAEAQAGAQLMFTAGAWIEAAIIVIFCARWYRAAAPDRSPRRVRPSSLSRRT
ncbi:cytochrome c oxidase assembly protein [Agromyces salentinus]|uniref:Cytochrome c oxidase assembly protein n=1 Tax=Agromyces salentinus TaxID=269421 RepID=A0ABN2MEI4_9MICO|nr:cytochrome c oxidase assembly protein [Agromyces salentinus]